MMDVKANIRSLSPQPLIAITTASVALVVMGECWLIAGYHSLSASDGVTGLTAVGLILLAVLAGQFPIYIRHNTKLCVTTVPLYFMVVLLPTSLATASAGLAVLVSEALARSKRGSTASDIATHVGRWIVLVAAASLVVHSHVASPSMFLHGFALVVAGFILWAGDILTLPLAVVPICGEHPAQVMKAAVKEGGFVEAAQYVAAIVVALFVPQHVEMLALLPAPTLLIYFLAKKEVDPETLELLESIADAADLRDPFTAEHSQRTAVWARAVLTELGMRGQEAAYIVTAARVHDIGKVEVPDQILLARGTLTVEERAIVDLHAEQGARFLMRYPDFSRVVEMVRHHHERWDGQGYPDGLKGTDIPFGARVIAIAECFDDMTSERAYRNALSVDRTLQILLEGSGRQWDPSIVHAFVGAIGNHLQNSARATPSLTTREVDALRSAVMT